MSLTDEQKRLRLTAIGSSEIAALAGEDKHRTAWDVWASKVGILEESEEPAPTGAVERRLTPMERGTLYESKVAELYQANHPEFRVTELSHGDKTWRHSKHAFAVASPDRLVYEPGGGPIERVLECKTAAGWLAGEWGEPGSSNVPTNYALQCQWLAMVVGVVRVDVPVLISWERYVEYSVPADPELQAGLVEIAARFVRDYLEPRKPPPLDASKAAKAWLQQQFPRPTADRIQAPPDAAQWAAQLRKAQEVTKEAAKYEAEAKAQLMALTGPHAGLDGKGFRVTWTETPPTVVKEHTRKGGRVLRVTFDKKELK